MFIIADSGSTKADWKIIDPHGNHRLVSTIGLNPYYISSEGITKEMKKNFVPHVEVEKVERVYFYGSGCSSSEKCMIVEKGLASIFPSATIEVQHDLLASARATCFSEAGIACILGTGSNSCEYNGSHITDNVSNLAYLVGDEGSGTHLGKKLIRAYFYRELPEELIDDLEEAYPGGKKAMLDNLYGDKAPNVYLASFAKFLSDHKDHLFVKRLVFESFAEFIDRNVRKYDNHMKYPIHFVGSVAYHFKDIMNLVLQERGMELGRVIQKPIDNLVKFHLRNTLDQTTA